MQGEILVAEIMDDLEQHEVWLKRQARNAEWYALKQWWKAEAAVRRARSTEERQRAQEQLRRTIRLYQPELERVWPKWDRVRAALHRQWIEE